MNRHILVLSLVILSFCPSLNALSQDDAKKTLKSALEGILMDGATKLGKPLGLTSVPEKKLLIAATLLNPSEGHTLESVNVVITVVYENRGPVKIVSTNTTHGEWNLTANKIKDGKFSGKPLMAEIQMSWAERSTKNHTIKYGANHKRLELDSNINEWISTNSKRSETPKHKKMPDNNALDRSRSTDADLAG